MRTTVDWSAATTPDVSGSAALDEMVVTGSW